MSPRRAKLLAVAALCVLSGCGSASLRTAARDWFVQDKSCPVERVTAMDTTSPKARPVEPPPPPEIAADPERLALWKKKQAAAAESAGHQAPHGCENYDASGYDCRTFAVSGCGARRAVCCCYRAQSLTTGNIVYEAPDYSWARCEPSD